MENKLWKGMKEEDNKILTENGALTYKSTTDGVLDLFAMGGALRKRPVEEIEKLFSRALAENKELAIKCLFYIRDVRGGQGERRTFREALKILSRLYPKETEKILELIPEYGRWDDLFYLENAAISNLLKDQLKKDLKSKEGVSLLAKWMPSENAGKQSKVLARRLMEYLEMSSEEYRKMLTKLRAKIKIVETKMSNKEWKKIDYEKLPSKAALKYKKAFKKRDEKRYDAYLNAVEKGKKKINTSTLYPYDIVRQIKQNAGDKTLELAWKNLPNYVKEDQRALVVADVSGSMMGLPMDVCVSLAIYFGERNKGPFANKFITFSGRPSLQEIRGKSLYEKITNLESAEWEQDTNLQAVFDLVLKTAIEKKVPKKDMPSDIYIISDMEFNDCVEGKTNLEVIKEKYKDSGYTCPNLIFWQVDSRQNNVPAVKNEKGVVLISGSSASSFRYAVEGKNPKQFMLEVLNSKRYDAISKALKKKK